MKKNRLIPCALALALALSMSVPAFAAEVTTAGSSGNVPVPLTAEAAAFSVTVPTSLPIHVSADGTVTTADSAAIVNNGHGAVKVTGLAVGGVGDWAIVGYDSANMPAEKVNAHKIAMTVNGEKTTGDDAITFTPANFPKLDGANSTSSDEFPIHYYAKVPAQSTALNAVAVVDVTFTIGWDE